LLSPKTPAIDEGERMKRSAMIAALFLTCAAAMADDFYIDGSCGFNGNGRYDSCAAGTDQNGAYNSGTGIQVALDAARCGDTIHVAPFRGVYYHDQGVKRGPNYEYSAFNMPRGVRAVCDARKPIVVTGGEDHRSKPKLCVHSDCSFDEGVPTIYVGRSENLRIDNLEIEGAIYVQGDGDNLLVRHLVVAYNDLHGGFRCDNNYSVLYLEGTFEATITHNFLHDLYGPEITKCEAQDYDLVQTFKNYRDDWSNNTFARGNGQTPKIAIDIKDKAEGVSFVGNDVEGGIYVFRQNCGGGPGIRCGGIQVHGNIFHAEAGFDIDHGMTGVTFGGGGTGNSAHGNTFVNGSLVVFDYDGQGEALLSAYNNIFIGQGTFECNNPWIEVTASAAVCDYINWQNISGYDFHNNVYPASGAVWRSVTSGTTAATFTTLSGWQAVVGEEDSITAACSFFNGYHVTPGTLCASAGENGTEVGAYGAATCAGHHCGETYALGKE
jgi:hypothetical protein